MTTVQDVLDHALRLGREDRAVIAHSLLESLAAKDLVLNPEQKTHADWEAELDRRCEDYDAGRVTGIEWREAMTQMQAGLQARKIS